MDIDQLRSFDRIVRDGSFTKAAARLNITQATISMRIRTLEQHVGGPLFSRGRRIALTERGITFLPYARRVLATLLESEEALRAVDRGRIAFAALRSLIDTLATPAVVDFMTAHPRVELQLEEGRHRDLAEWLHDRHLDLAVMGWPNFDPLLETLEPIAVMREPAILAAAPSLAAAIGPAPTLDRIFEIAPHFLTFFWWQVTPDAIAALRHRARTTSQVLFAPGVRLIESGQAIGHLLGPSIRDELASGRLVDLAPIDMPVAFRDSALVAGTPDALQRPLVAELAERIVARATILGILHADRR
ncbi:LysR family transcriptional regulator [Kaistia dalseonensis]|uniref:DNA-binding transcriptional LysR family regulator n=1 Tax=Kaistia dalseonensis TaxID=410840 RepID=A0ABU0H9T5_9HYPH|nr:LysR family transcriptional regulator [Kaistia dalseonensis]MCX5496464.1 LysR family transcriptional regulator [Kaistia dalseonensis]MDQ0439086.1 DNA-binding transcriptional LysR family regulator [Kaistia dalseonensis]